MKFEGYPPQAIAFLRDLTINNNREWFTENKHDYKEFVEVPSTCFMEEMSARLTDLAGQPIAGKVFRIYRDVRFSKDKTPYNNHVRMLFTHAAGKKKSCGDSPVFCFSLETDTIIIGAGNNGFSPATMQAYRDAVAHDTSGPAIAKLTNKFAKAKGYRLDPPELKRVPAGYEKDHKRESLLRHKSLMIWHEQPHPKSLHAPTFTTHTLNQFKKLKPLYDWLEAI